MKYNVLHLSNPCEVLGIFVVFLFKNIKVSFTNLFLLIQYKMYRSKNVAVICNIVTNTLHFWIYFYVERNSYNYYNLTRKLFTNCDGSYDILYKKISDNYYFSRDFFLYKFLGYYKLKCCFK